MKTQEHFFKAVCALAIPVALQSMLQSSFSMVDQIMIGQLGEINVAGVGLAGKFASIYSVVISAIGAVAGIMIAQYLGQKNRSEVRRSFLYKLAAGNRHCRNVYGNMHPVSESDHGSLYQRCADPSGGSRIFDADFRNFCSYGWSNPSFHIVPLFGKTPASPICQHSVSVVEYWLELHYDFRQAGDLTHGCAWCGICYSNFPMCQFST